MSDRDGPGRDRGPDNRPRSARPRDPLGRPLPYGSPGIERQPEGTRRTPIETLTEAQRLLESAMPFHAHEVLEDAWRAAVDADREMWRALAQLAVGITHAARGNQRGALALLRRGAAALAPYASAAPYGLDIMAIRRWAATAARTLVSEAPVHLGSPPLIPAQTRNSSGVAAGDDQVSPGDGGAP